MTCAGTDFAISGLALTNWRQRCSGLDVSKNCSAALGSELTGPG